MPKTGISAVLIIGLLAGSAIGVVAQEDGSGPVLALDTGDLFCVLASDEVEADRLHEAIVAEAVTITVVPKAECAPDAALDAPSDAEHFGVFMGHVLETIPTMTALRDEPRMIPEGAPARTWLAELAADPAVLEAYVASSDRLVALLEDEIAWLEAHPSRSCWAVVHEAFGDWYGEITAVMRSMSTAIRTQDAELLGRTYVDLRALDARNPPDINSLGQTCWDFAE